METPLNPCPFCGAAGSLVVTPDGFHFVECSNLVDCSKWPMTHASTELAPAVNAWNAGSFRRPSPTTTKP
jgi:ssDNA-binding Zn-finger/Zn-ribbon topoisomerase 1